MEVSTMGSLFAVFVLGVVVRVVVEEFNSNVAIWPATGEDR